MAGVTHATSRQAGWRSLCDLLLIKRNFEKLITEASVHLLFSTQTIFSIPREGDISG